MTIASRLRHTPARLVCVAALATFGGCSSSDNSVNSDTSPFQATFAGEANAGPGVRMSAGDTADGQFIVRIEILGPLDDVYSVSFRVHFDPEFMSYLSLDSSNSFLVATDVDTHFSGQLLGDDLLVVSATRVGADDIGVDVAGAARVVEIRFAALAATGPSGTEITFAAERAVRVCSAPNDPCSQIDNATLNWTGGGVVIIDLTED